MKMMFQIKPTRPKFFGGIFFKVLAVFLLILIFVLVFGVFNGTRSLAADIFSPFFKAGDYFYKSLSQIKTDFSSRSSLIEANKNLSDEIEKTRLDLIDYESVKYENQKLRETLGLKPAVNSIAATIVARPPQIPLDSLFLNKGSAAGVNKGDLVLTSDRILAGKIVEVSNNKSTAALNSFAGAASYGFVARTSEPIEIKGMGGGSLEAKVPIDFDIVAGDQLMVSGSLTYFVSVVGAVEEDRSAGFKNVLMSLPIDISKINTVFISPVISQ